MIRLGELDRKAIFYHEVETGRNAKNEPVTRREELTRARARRRDVSDAERFQAGRQDAALVSRFVVLSRTATRRIREHMEFRCDGLLWQVQGMKQVDLGRNRFLEITAVSVNENLV
ncbi:phage head closure protein [Tateyamaria sp. syn59]|uniref:phage head closure protein n=1 Tax=Tateyamaria sp. syn59 TaxID=2576942 RepID=UPI0011BE509E|nr:phage head closure protein [Tateyamaria sp. syn59]